MKLRGFTYLALAAVLASSLSATSAEARMTPNNSTPETSNSAVGLIVKYKPAVSPIAPNGEPTGENFAGVDLENSVDLGNGFKSVDFADDLTSDEVADAVDRISLDPRVESASPNQVVEIAKNIPASPRGEYEITDVNKVYLERKQLQVGIMNRGTAWLDTGTFESLADACEFVRVIEKRQSQKIGCIEEVAYRMGFIDKAQLMVLADKYAKSGYGEYLRGLKK